MKEISVRQELFRLVHNTLDAWPITQMDTSICPKCKTQIRPKAGRPDIMVLNPWGRSFVIEVKAIRGGSFSFAQIEPQQRQWLTNWLNSEGLGYVGIGTMTQPRRAWLIDWKSWLEIEQLVTGIQNSLPVVAGKGYNLELQEKGWDFEHLCKPWELKRITGGWELPAGHSLRRLYETRLAQFA